jgi:hypothetical protein
MKKGKKLIEEQETEWRYLFNGITRTVGAVKVSIRKNNRLLERNYAHVGKIVSCHLVIENLMLKWLLENIPDKKNTIETAKFSHKLKMLPSKDLIFMLIIPGIKSLNAIRNKLVHNIDYDISNAETKEFDTINKLVNKSDVSEMTIEEKISLFTNACMLAFALKSKSVIDSWKPFMSDSQNGDSLSLLPKHITKK